MTRFGMLLVISFIDIGSLLYSQRAVRPVMYLL